MLSFSQKKKKIKMSSYIANHWKSKLQKLPVSKTISRLPVYGSRKQNQLIHQVK